MSRRFKELVLFKNGNPVEEAFRELLRMLDKRESGTSTVTRIIQGTPLPTGGSGGSGSSVPAPSQPTANTGFWVPNTIGATVGMAVNYSDKALALADVRNAARFATHFVVNTDGATGTCQLETSGSRIAILTSGAGNNNNAILWLYRDGTVTDDRSQVIDANGYLTGGAVFSQIVGVRQGKRTGFCDAHWNIAPPRDIAF